jgi:glycosyltransferase involved in cell wall biosynthesis
VRILGVVDKLGARLLDRGHILGGAETTALIHLKNLQREYGYKCRIATPYPVKRRMTCGGIAVESFRDLEEFKQILRHYQPDVVLSSLDIIYESVRLTRSFGVPNFIFLDSYEYCEPTTPEKLMGGLSPTKSYPSPEEAKFAVMSADRVLVCSKHLENKIAKSHGVDCEVVYPAFEPAKVLLKNFLPDSGGFITGICGFPHKGIEIFHELCRRFERERFLLIGNLVPEWQAKFQQCTNVTIGPSAPIKKVLAQSKIVLVPSQWEEPFGRIAVEAMVNGIPTLASFTGGLKEIVGRSALGVRDFRSADAWENKLRQLLNSDVAYAKNAVLGPKLGARFLGDDSGRKLHALIQSSVKVRLQEGAKKRRLQKRRGEKQTLAFIGSASKKTAFAIINAHLQTAFGDKETYSVINCNVADETGLEAVDYFIHHDFESQFSNVVAPKEGKWIVVRPWDFGKYPETWASKIREECDQLWIHSRWTRQLALRSGIPAKQVKLIPLGFDEKVFKPQGDEYSLPTRKNFKFLFVGAAIMRKGLDILLKAYGEAFSRDDDVCLIIKGNRQDVFYTGIGMREHILQLQQDPHYPEIIFIDDFLTPEQLAALYRACDAGVFPYRAEGFAMPILEAMACGLPSIVPDFGACLDYCSGATSFPIPVTRIALPVMGNFQFNTMGFEEEIEEVDFCETPVAHLAREMTRVFHLPKATMEKKAAMGVKISYEKFKWTDSVEKMIAQLTILDRTETPLRFRRKRAASEQDMKKFEIASEEDMKKFEIARELFLSPNP